MGELFGIRIIKIISGIVFTIISNTYVSKDAFAKNNKVVHMWQCLDKSLHFITAHNPTAKS